jgi:diguanylate cyclase (GGDEF)-like protein/PAS domain S-box-containing protein
MVQILDSTWLDAVPDAVLVVDARGVIVRANRRCESLLGWSPEELTGQPVERLVPARVSGHAAHRERFAAAPARRQMGADLVPSALHRSGDEIAVDIVLNPVLIDGAPYVVAAVRDVREQRRAVEQLRAQSVALAAAASGVVITNREGVITWLNPAACRMTGYSAQELIGQRPSVLKSGQHDAAFYGELWATITAGRTWQGAIINRRKDGSLYDEEQTIAPVFDAGGELTHFIAIKQDVTDRNRVERALRETRDELTRRVVEVEALHGQLREQATRDPLSGLFNRRYLDETLPRELANAHRAGTPLTLAVIDIDHFKDINDGHSHATGDRVLVELARILRAQSRVGDVTCRYGGDEFVVALLGATLADGLRRAEGWRRSFRAAAIEAGGGSVHATLSASVAEWVPGESPADLLARADGALYVAKAAGRDRVVPAAAGGTRRFTPRA